MSPTPPKTNPKHLSNPFSTGSGGANFENQIRTIGITSRLHEELSKLWAKSSKQPHSSVFGYDPDSSMKTAWATLRKK